MDGNPDQDPGRRHRSAVISESNDQQPLSSDQDSVYRRLGLTSEVKRLALQRNRTQMELHLSYLP